MAFQALLFCPDEKTARTVTQVLSELEFNVEPCTEPFAAVKKLMSGHFDALVVDCDNEQNATLLFKSARNSTSNQTSLAVAIVEGQAGVAKAFRIGANLVLTKPINVEQSKGTLRVARGLLRKGEPVKPGAQAPAPSAPVATTPVPPKPTVPKPAPAAKPAPVSATSAASSPASVAPRRSITAPVLQPPESVAAAQAAASSGLAEPERAPQIKKDPVTTSAPAAPSKLVAPAPSKAASIAASNSFGGAASAPAPAREAQAPAHEVPANQAPTRTEKIVESTPAMQDSPLVSEAPAPSFTFGGANAAEESDDGGRKKIFIGVAAAILIVVLGYAAYAHFSGSSSQQGSHTAAVTTTVSTPGSPQPAPAQPVASAPTPQPSQPAATQSSSTQPPSAQPASTQSTDAASQPAASAADSDAAEESAPAESRTTTKSATPSTSASKTNASTKSAPAPLVVKGGAVQHTKPAPAAADAPAPDVVAMAGPASSGALSNLVSSTAAPKPVLQTVSISQGVSQGLLMKKVQPVYPKAAMTMRIEGAVELLATISKNGDITNVKVLKGDPQLTHAASDAVKQWKYKPYLLNGEPVEITTQVTINFKLPN